ncbi:GmrSD restriction endonuclease domain-containing protein [Arenibacterium sp. CAU 1754]
MNNQPKPDSKTYDDLISDVKKGIIKVPKFQRDFVWDLKATAKLLDSILKGYPIGTFILWETDQRINDIKNIGGFDLPETPVGRNVQYVLDGQQRITSLFAAYLGAQIRKPTEKKVTDYKDIVVNLEENLEEKEKDIVTVKDEAEVFIPLHDVLNFNHKMGKKLENEGFEEWQIDKIDEYSNAFSTYAFSTVTLRQNDIESAIEVFTRINTGGKVLTLFEIMSAKTYDEAADFDMQARWEKFQKRLNDSKYENISPSVLLQILSLVISESKECKRKTILGLDKADIIARWDDVISAIEKTIDHFRTVLRIPVSQILPYDTLIVPFAYFFLKTGKSPSGQQRKYLEELFWRSSLSLRYSSATESKLAADIKKVDLIIAGQRPAYPEFKLFINSAQDLRETDFSTGNAICKSILCILAYHEPKDFDTNGKVLLDNSYLKIASSKNYHHFFPRAFVRKHGSDAETPYANSIVNITLVSAELNKKRIGAKAPSVYLADFADENSELKHALSSHLIELDDASVVQDDFTAFLKRRSEVLYAEILKRIEPSEAPAQIDPIHEMILEGEGQLVEFKSTLRYDMRTGEVNKKLEHVVAKTVAAFMNSDGGSLFIGVDDHGNAIGLELDCGTLSKKDRDGFQLHIANIFDKFLGKDVMKLWKLNWPTYDDKQICHVEVTRANKPVYVISEGKEEFFVRKEGSSQPLSRAEEHEWNKGRF